MFTFFALLHCAMRLCEQINTRYFIGTVIGLFLGLFQLYSNYLSERSWAGKRQCERSAAAQFFHTRESQKHATSSPLLFRQATHTRQFTLFSANQFTLALPFSTSSLRFTRKFSFKATFSLFAVELGMKRGKCIAR